MRATAAFTTISAILALSVLLSSTAGGCFRARRTPALFLLAAMLVNLLAVAIYATAFYAPSADFYNLGYGPGLVLGAAFYDGVGAFMALVSSRAADSSSTLRDKDPIGSSRVDSEASQKSCRKLSIPCTESDTDSSPDIDSVV